MKIIINESQLRLIIENEEKLMIIPGDILKGMDSFERTYNFYNKKKEKKNYVGIKVFGDFDVIYVMGRKLSTMINDFCNNIVSVDGDLVVIRNDEVRFPKLKMVNGDIRLSMTNISELPKLEYVGGDFILKATPLSKKTTKEELKSKINVGGEIHL